LQNIKNKIFPYESLKEAQLSMGVMRVFFYLFIWLFTYPEYLFKTSHNPEGLWLPQGVFKFLSGPLLIPEKIIPFLVYSWHFLAAACVLGLFFRFSSVAFLVMTYFMYNLAHSYGYQTHTVMPLILVLIILASSPAGEFLSLDYFLKRRNPSDLSDYNLTVLACRFIFCIVFFAAGISKVVNGGIEWITSDNLQNILIQTQIYFPDTKKWASSFKFALELARHPLLCHGVAAAIIGIELTVPLSLYKSSFRGWLIGLLLFAQFCFYFVLLVNFKTYLALYLFWINPASIVDYIQTRMPISLNKRAL
jgi:uncharacterized membrane protein YphA (DoxX/SURF4 family)